MLRIIFLILIYLGAAFVFDLWPFEPEILPLSKYEDVDVNVYFYSPSPSEREVFLGSARGASSCGAIAYAFAREKGLNRSDDWSYICCTIRKGSQCYEKIR